MLLRSEGESVQRPAESILRESPLTRSWQWITRPSRAWPLLFALALLLRLWRLDRVPLWLDETALIIQAHTPFPDLLKDVLVVHPTPPLFVLFMSWWVPAGPPGEIWARLPSAVFGAIFVVATGWLGTELGGRRAGILAGILATINPLALWYAQEARTYALSMALASLVLAVEVRFLRKGRWPWIAALIGLTIGLELSHYAAVLVLGIATVVAFTYRAPAPRRIATLGGLWFGAIPLFATQEARDYLTTLARSLPLLSGSPGGSQPYIDLDAILGGLHSLWDPWTRAVGGPAIELQPWLAVATASAGILACLAIIVRGPRVARWIVLGFLLTATVAFAVPQTRTLLSERYLTLTVGALLGAAGVALDSIRHQRTRRLVPAVALLIFILADAVYLLHPSVGKGPNYREPARYLAGAAQDGDVIVEADGDQTFIYYALQVFHAPATILRPRGGQGGETAEETAQDLVTGMRTARAAWYTPRWTEAYWDPQQRIRRWLEANLCLEADLEFDVVELRHYLRC